MKKPYYTQMLSKCLKTAIFILLFTGVVKNSNAQYTKTFKANIGLVYPLSTNGAHAPLDTNNLSLNLIAGISSAENGSSFAGLSNVVRHYTKGAQFAGFSNHIGTEANGALFAGFLNTYRSAKGVQFAGFANIAQANITGGQFAGFINTVKNLKGSQFAGFINVSKNVTGNQFAGFINIAKNVKGIQAAGFINIAENSDSPIGIINLVKNGEKSIAATIDDQQTSMLTFRSGGKHLYGIIGIGYNFKNKEEVYAFEAGLGAHFFQSKHFRLNTELVQGMLESFERGEYIKSTLRVLPALKITKSFEIFAGPSLNFVSTNSPEGLLLHPESDKNVLHIWNSRWSDYKQTLYVGYQAGLQVIF